MTTKVRTTSIIGAVIAGILYCSWPLGYFLNPVVAAHSLASGLEAPHQPYNWLFIGLDVVSSMVVLGLVTWWYFDQKAQFTTRTNLFLWGVAAFAIGTIVDALYPENCVPGVQVCASFTRNSSLFIHGAFSIAASVALFWSLCVVWYHCRRNVVFVAILLNYILFGVISLWEAVLPTNTGNWSQHYYITLCSVWLAFVPYALGRLLTAYEQRNNEPLPAIG